MNENELVVKLDRIEQRGQGMPALVRSVMHRQLLHRPVPAAPEGIIGISRTDDLLPLPCGQEGEYPLTDGYFTHPSLCLAVPYINIAFPYFYILRSQGQVLPDA